SGEQGTAPLQSAPGVSRRGWPMGAPVLGDLLQRRVVDVRVIPRVPPATSWPPGGRRGQIPPWTSRRWAPAACRLRYACPAAASADSDSWRPAAPALSPADDGPWRGPAGNRSRPATPPGRLAAATHP